MSYEPIKMKGSYELTLENIDKYVTKKSAGNYRLGYRDDEGSTFYITYIGRADIDLNKRLKQWVNSDDREKSFKRFKFEYAIDEQEAYSIECQEYHHWKSLKHNDIHPAKPKGTNCKCPVRECDK